MKVNNIQNVLFCGTENKKSKSQVNNNYSQIKELSPVTPDFLVKTPQSYKKNGVLDLPNGLKLHSYKLANGLKVSVVPMEDSPAVVKSYVNVGSMNETPNIKGISHFLEHMAFNGTNGDDGHMKLEVGDSFKKIDALGGWANASTNYAITDYVNSAPLLNNTDLEQQIKVIAAMTEDLKLSPDMIEKEKHPVCSEINMILDNAQTIALDQTIRTLFNIKNPADELVGGSVKHIKNLTRDDVLNYYNKYYTPDNMNVVITGNVDPDEAIKIVAKNFVSKKVSKGEKFEEPLNPIDKTIRKDFVNDKTKSCDIVLGFTGPKNSDTKERIIYTLAKAYLTSYATDVNKNLKPYNTSIYVDEEKISTNPNAPRFTFAAVTVSNENCEKVLRTLFDSISSIKQPDEKIVDELKRNILRVRSNAFEYSSDVNDIVGYAVLNNNTTFVTDYEKLLDSVTPEEVFAGVKKYFDLNKTAITVIHPKENDKLSFKGNERKPINTSKISAYKLGNEFNLGLYNTKNDNISYNLMLYPKTPYNKKAGVVEVLDEMFSMGTDSKDENEIIKFQDENNLDIYSSVSPAALKISIESGFDTREKAYSILQEKLKSPRLNEETLAKAKNRIKESLSRLQYNARTLYLNEESKNNPYDFSDEEVSANIDTITLDDVLECYNYILNNSRGIITANVPEKHQEVKQEILKLSSKMPNVLPNQIEMLHYYEEPTETTIYKDINNNSQADIMQVHKYKHDGSVRMTMLTEIANSILTNSSIGLFDVLREKEHLAYSVYSDASRTGDKGEISCNILTTTDNKEIGEFSYDNLQKSINGFNRQIQCLKDGEFTEQDLINAKLSLKANMLNTEGTDAKLNSIKLGMNSKFGIKYENKLFAEIDKITKEDVMEFASYAFKNPPTYSITATKDTLDYNDDYLNSLKNN